MPLYLWYQHNTLKVVHDLDYILTHYTCDGDTVDFLLIIAFNCKLWKVNICRIENKHTC